MHRHLSPQDAAFRDRLRTYFRQDFPSEIRDKVIAGEELSQDDIVTSMKLLNAQGLAVPRWPRQWGGQDWSELQEHLYLAEMQSAGVPMPLVFNASMIGPVLAAFGSVELKERFLPATANLDIWWAQGFSEPNAGSDLASLTTKAVRDGDDYVVNGQKTWTTLGQHADWIFLLARTDPDAPKKQQGISMLLVDMRSPGVELRPIQLLDGSYEVNEVFFTDVRVPAELLVGAENQGWDIAKFLLGNERVGVAPVGSIKLWLARAKDYAGQVRTETGTLLDDPGIAGRFAELEADVMALELTVLRVAGNSKGGRPDPASSILKLRGTQLQQAVTDLVIDIAGPMAARWSVPDGSQVPGWAARSIPHYLNFRKASIYGGSNEVQRQIIASGILALKG